MSCSSTDPPGKKRRGPKPKPPEAKKQKMTKFAAELEKNQAAIAQIEGLLNGNLFLTKLLRSILKTRAGETECCVKLQQLIKSQGPIKKKEFVELIYNTGNILGNDNLFNAFIGSILNNRENVNSIVVGYVIKNQKIMINLLKTFSKCTMLTSVTFDKVHLALDHTIILFENLSNLKTQIEKLVFLPDSYYNHSETLLSNSPCGKDFAQKAAISINSGNVYEYSIQRIKKISFFENNQTLKHFEVKVYGQPYYKYIRQLDDHQMVDPFYVLWKEFFFQISKCSNFEQLICEFEQHIDATEPKTMYNDVIFTIIHNLQKNTLKTLNFKHIRFENREMAERFWIALQHNDSLEILTFRDEDQTLQKNLVLLPEEKSFYRSRKLTHLSIEMDEKFDESINEKDSRHLTFRWIVYALQSRYLQTFSLINFECGEKMMRKALPVLLNMFKIKSLNILHMHCKYYSSETNYFTTQQYTQIAAYTKRHPNITRLHLGKLHFPHYGELDEEKFKIFTATNNSIKRNIFNENQRSIGLFQRLWKNLFDETKKDYKK